MAVFQCILQSPQYQVNVDLAAVTAHEPHTQHLVKETGEMAETGERWQISTKPPFENRTHTPSHDNDVHPLSIELYCPLPLPSMPPCNHQPSQPPFVPHCQETV